MSIHATTMARLEDLAWMAETGENASGAARRLGMNVHALDKWCQRHGMQHVFRTLASREPGACYRPNSHNRKAS